MIRKIKKRNFGFSHSVPFFVIATIRFSNFRVFECVEWEIEITSVNLIFFHEKKVSKTSCRARRAVFKNFGLRLQNRLLWRPHIGLKTRKMFSQPTGHMS